MSQKILIAKDKLKCLRRYLDQANEIFNGLEVDETVREPKTPELSPQEKRIRKYDSML